MKHKKTILITGSEGKIGAALTNRFQEGGWRVVGMDIKECKSSADHYFKCDVTCRQAMVDIITDIEKNISAIDAVFTAAGASAPADFQHTEPEEWKQLLDTWLGGVSNVCAAAAPAMVSRGSGKIMLLCPDYKNVNSDCILEATAVGTIHGFAKCFGVEMGPANVMVNAIAAGLPADTEAIAETACYLAQTDTYTTAQVIAIAGLEEMTHEI